MKKQKSLKYWSIVDVTKAAALAKSIIYEPTYGEKLEIDLPLTSKCDISMHRSELGLPSYINVDSFHVEKAIVILWACKRAKEFVPEEGVSSINVALFGGCGFKLSCQSTNSKGPFHRNVNDIDVVTTKEQGKALVKLLCVLGDKQGSRYYTAITKSDRRFNALRGGMRYRVRTIKEVDDIGTPKLGMMDIFCDKLTFCHQLIVTDEVKQAEKHGYTIGLENLLLTKAQFIRRVAREQLMEEERYRLLGELDKNNIIIGMERKDMRDVSAILVDHEIGDGHDQISARFLKEKLRKDWRLAKTVTLNLKNLRSNGLTLNGLGIGAEQIRIIQSRLDQLLAICDEVRPRFGFGLSKEWWEEVEDQTIEAIET